MIRLPRTFCRQSVQRGFTLIELMVVLVIMSIASAAIGLSIRPDPARVLRQDAQRLAQLFIVAQSEVRIDGRAITWQADQAGYRFVRPSWQYLGDDVVPTLSARGPADTFAQDDTLRPRRWQDGAVSVTPATHIVLGTEWIAQPWRIQLSDGKASVAIVRDAAGKYSVQ